MVVLVAVLVVAGVPADLEEDVGEAAGAEGEVCVLMAREGVVVEVGMTVGICIPSHIR